MRFLATAILLLIFTLDSLACLNHYHVNGSGKTTTGRFDLLSFRLVRFEKQRMLADYKIVTDTLKKRLSIEYYSDYGALLLKAGYFNKGLEVFRFLNKKKPNEYNIVANLATAYELNGKNDSALFWINRALQLNTMSHYGSEWIHKQILEAKISMQKNPSWLSSHAVFSGTNLKHAEVLDHFGYQLHERIPFTGTPDALMSEILEQYGDLVLQQASVSEAWKIFSAAKAYNPANPGIDKKIENARRLTAEFRAKSPKKTNLRHWPTDKSIEELVNSFQQHRMVAMAEIKPVLFH